MTNNTQKKRKPREYTLLSTRIYDHIDNLTKYKTQYATDMGYANIEKSDRANWSDNDWQEIIYAEIQMLQDDFWKDLESYMNQQNEQTWVLTGQLGLWNGNPDAYKQVDQPEQIKNLICGRYIEDIEAVQEGTRLIFHMYHHDGTNTMELRRINAKGEAILQNTYQYESILESFDEKGQNFIKNYTKNFGNFAKDVYSLNTK